MLCCFSNVESDFRNKFSPIRTFTKKSFSAFINLDEIQALDFHLDYTVGMYLLSEVFL